MRRLIDSSLLRWKTATRRKPLVIRGARQVGKTYAAARLGAEHFAETAIVDFERNRRLHRVFAGDLSANRILAELRVLLDREITPGRSLLFLDEIQACPRALMALRYLYEECPELHVIAAGSLLDFALAEISFPVGRVQFLDMHPLGLAEFLWAKGRDQAAELILSRPSELPEPVHTMLLDELRNYLFVGGMPESVAAYTQGGSLRDAFAVHHELCESFRADFSKYAPRSNPDCLDAVLHGIARNAGQQIRYTRLAEGYSIPTIKRAFDLLTKARVASKVTAASPAELPLAATASAKKFKALMVDIGLLQHLRQLPVEAALARTDLLAIHEGAMAEQFVGQEMMLTQGGDLHHLHYWARQAKSSTAEVDYLAVIDGAIVPIEVKSGAAGRLRSLHRLLADFPGCPGGVVFSSRPYSTLPDQRLTFVPIYFAYAATRCRGSPPADQ